MRLGFRWIQDIKYENGGVSYTFEILEILSQQSANQNRVGNRVEAYELEDDVLEWSPPCRMEYFDEEESYQSLVIPWERYQEYSKVEMITFQNRLIKITPWTPYSNDVYQLQMGDEMTTDTSMELCLCRQNESFGFVKDNKFVCLRNTNVENYETIMTFMADLLMDGRPRDRDI